MIYMFLAGWIAIFRTFNQKARLMGIVIRGVVALIFFGIAAVLFGGNVYFFLKTGEWKSDSVMDFIIVFFETPDGRVWSFFSEWVGLADILRAIPAYALAFVLSVLVLIVGE